MNTFLQTYKIHISDLPHGCIQRIAEGSYHEFRDSHFYRQTKIILNQSSAIL